jgi:hypothetical protein
LVKKKVANYVVTGCSIKASKFDVDYNDSQTGFYKRFRTKINIFVYFDNHFYSFVFAENPV